MIPIEYKNNTNNIIGISQKGAVKPKQYAEYLEKYYNILVPPRKSKKIDKLNLWCKTNIGLEKEVEGTEWSFKDVVCASPLNIFRIKQLIDSLSDRKRSDLTEISGYVVSGLYSQRMKLGARDILEKNLNVHVCPYCNRNLIGQIHKNGKNTTTCELDHFFPKGGKNGKNKDGYSLLAVSFYNLIPVCHYCNMVKGENALKVFYPYMINWDMAHSIKFTYYPLKVDFLYNTESVDVGMRIDKDALYDRYDDKGGFIQDNSDENTGINWNKANVLHDIDVLKLLEVYQNSRYEVQKVLKKTLVFSDEYSKMIYDSYKEYFSSVEEVSNLMVDRPSSDSDIAETPFGKLRQDIAKEIEKENKKY